LNDIVLYLVIFAVAFLVSAAATPIFRVIAKKTSFLDIPQAE